MTNSFLVETRNPLALTYNDQSVLENMHVATLFGILSDEQTNIFQVGARDNTIFSDWWTLHELLALRKDVYECCLLGAAFVQSELSKSAHNAHRRHHRNRWVTGATIYNWFVKGNNNVNPDMKHHFPMIKKLKMFNIKHEELISDRFVGMCNIVDHLHAFDTYTLTKLFPCVSFSVK